MSRSYETHMELALHRCWKIRVSRHYPDISNAIAVEILTEEGHGIEVMMYGHDAETTEALLASFRDDKTTISHGPARGEDVAA